MTLMANQRVFSSSSLAPSWRYDVFLSFRGDDTRTNFTDHLYEALVRKGINTFIDRELTRGEEISPALLKAIEESRISIIVFSKNYASSRWCLNELVKILECKESKQQIVWPIFYKVDPSHVRNQMSSFGDAFKDLEFKVNKKKVLRWRRALREAANLSGHTFKRGEYEATFINNIVENILVQVLNRTYLNVAKYPVGIYPCIQDVEKLLDVDGNKRCMVGIWGTSGIGKTTIAKAIYNAIAHKFEGSCFLADVRETSISHGGQIQLQNTLLSTILRSTKFKIVDAHQGIDVIKKLLRHKKILLILDDVDQLDQLNNLAEVDWLGEGSKIIITTKDRGLLTCHGVELIYEVQKLYDDQALELLCMNAFGRNEPPDAYLKLARRAIAYAQGLPLALTLIGSHLRNKSIDRWQAILDSYNSCEREPYRSIKKILRKSFDSWEYFVQQVFLDIACFFKGEDKDYVGQILRSSKLNVPQDCIEVLVEKAIITIQHNKILMHDLLEQLGKHIVREESPTEPGKRSRLWFHEDVYNVLTENQGTGKIKGIMVKLPKPDVIFLNAKSFFRMVNLEIFINRNAHFSGYVAYLPNDLRWIELGGCHLQCFGSNNDRSHLVRFNLPSTYHPRHLVMFDMSYSGIRQLAEFKNLETLTSINLRGCEFLEKIPDLSGIPNIKYLDLSGCTSLTDVDDSVGFLDKLVELDLSGSSKLTRFPTKLRLRSLEWLSLRGCEGLESFPEIVDQMESLWNLELQGSGIRELPSSVAYLTGLQELIAYGCMNLTNAPLHRIHGLQHLYRLDFGACPKLVTFGNKMKFDEVPSCRAEFQLHSTDLDVSDDNYVSDITLTLPKLQFLELGGCNLSESDFFLSLDCWSTLTKLDLSGNSFITLPECISEFVNLDELILSGCKRLREIPKVLPPRLVLVYLNDCISLEKIPKLPPKLEYLDLSNCFRLRGEEVAKLENNLLNQESLQHSELIIIVPGNEVPKWFSYTSKHPTTFQLPLKNEGEEVVRGSKFCFEIPLTLQGKTSGLALSIVFEPPNYDPDYPYILVNRKQEFRARLKGNIEATHVWLTLLDLHEQQDMCSVIFHYRKGPRECRIKSCGVHPLLRNQEELLPLCSGPMSNLAKRHRPSGASDIAEYDINHQEQWLSLSLEPSDDHPKRRHIDLNVPVNVDTEEEQEQPSTSDEFWYIQT